MTNEHGAKFLSRVREIIEECSRLETPAHAARVTAFALCVMLDGSGESLGTQYTLKTDTGKPVLFEHRNL